MAATIPVPAVPLPNPGDDMYAEQVRDWVQAVVDFLQGTFLEEGNVNTSATTGLVGKSLAQTITGAKTFDAEVILTGTYDKPLRIGTIRIWDDTTTGCTRVKRGIPSSMTDGSIIPEV
jgi:hypothetical protein